MPTGTPVFDWTVPKEWNIRDAYIKDSSGKRVVDFRKCNLHVLNYSSPVHATMPLSELRPICSRFPNIRSGFPTGPPTTSRNGDFVSHTTQLHALKDGDYEVFIDSTLEDGHLDLRRVLYSGAPFGRGLDIVPRLSSVAGE